MSNNTKYGPQLRMSIVHCTSQDEVFPVTELQSRTAYTSGWQSAKYCDYPQELGFRFEGEVDIQYLRILCHESKIPSRIEVYIAEATEEDRRTVSFPNYSSAVFRRLGHINLASNEENNFAARELKTINVRRNSLYLKLIIRKNHSNLINVFNQVGIVALSAHGSVLCPFKQPKGSEHDIIVGGDDEVPMEQIFVANRGEREKGFQDQGANFGGSFGGGGGDDTQGGSLDPITGRRVRELTLHKARAIEQEDYDLAKALKEQIELLKIYGAQIAVLEANKLLAVEAEEYDKAKALKLQIDELRAKGNAKPGRAPAAALNIGGLDQPSTTHRQPHRAPVASSQRNRGYDPQDEQAEADANDGEGASPTTHNTAIAGMVHDDASVGGGAASFDDRPAVAGKGPRSNQMYDEYPPGYVPPTVSEGDRGKKAGVSPPKAAPKAKRSVPAPQRATIERLSEGPVGNDELACTAKGAVNMDDETGGIVVKAPVSVTVGKVAPTDSDKMPPWEKRLNVITSDVIGDQGAPEMLASAKLTEYKEYVSIFGNFVTCCLFSKRWQLRESALRAIVSDEGYGILVSEAPQGYAALPQLLLYLGAKGCGVHDTLANVFFAACDVLSLVVSERLTAKGSPLSSMVSSILPLLPELILKAGDNNSRVREKASQVLLQIASSPIGAERISGAALAEPTPEGGSKKPLSHRIHLARIHLVQSLIEEIGLKGKSGLTVEGIMQKLCVPCLGHSHQDVREASQKLVAVLYHYSTPTVMDKFLGALKPAQRQLIDEQISALEAAGGPPPPGSKQSMNNIREVNNDGPQQTSSSPVAKPSRPKKPAEPEMVSSSFSVGCGQAEVLSAARAAGVGSKSPQAAKSRGEYRDPDKFCQYCNKYDERFTEDNLDLHLVRDCPMLCPCPLCGQVTEISQLQPHLVTECDRRSLVKQCPLCFEAVRAEDLEAHVDAAECIKADPKRFSLCPLCHAKFPAGPEGWLKHFASSPGCPNNPRPWDGGDIGIE